MTMTTTVVVAAAQYGVEFVGTWEAYAAKITWMVEDAAAQGARMLLFPEYACLELASLFPAAVHANIDKLLVALQTLLPAYLHLHGTLARRHHCHIVAGSFPERLSDGSYRNRAFFFHPDGRMEHQDKLMMTRFEREVWFITPGDEIRTFATPWGRVGINICYDSEFPLIARHQVEQGAGLILVPTCTDTAAGYNRVKLGSRARALENQCFVAMAPVVGATPWLDAFDVTVGAAGHFSPVDYGFPDDGVLAEGTLNQPGWVCAEIDLAASARIRAEGQVTNYRDWSRQHALQAASPATENWLVPALVTSAAAHHHPPAHQPVDVHVPLATATEPRP